MFSKWWVVFHRGVLEAGVKIAVKETHNGFQNIDWNVSYCVSRALDLIHVTMVGNTQQYTATGST